MSSHFWVIMHWGAKNHPFGWAAEASGNQPGGLADLHGLGAPLCAELIKEPVRRVFTVFSLTNSRAAISRLLKPAAMRPRISSSRAVMPSWLTRVSSATNGPAAGTGISLMASGGSFLVSVSPSQSRARQTRWRPARRRSSDATSDWLALARRSGRFRSVYRRCATWKVRSGWAAMMAQQISQLESHGLVGNTTAMAWESSVLGGRA